MTKRNELRLLELGEKAMLKETFIALISKYSDNAGLPNKLWTEIEKNYSGRKRHYHTLRHLEDLWAQLINVKKDIQNWDATLFALYYHDIIYNSLRSNNEEKSAAFAESMMKEAAVPQDVIQLCKKQILATKSHLVSGDSDVDYFTDADLSILGQSWEIYAQYCRKVRKEYSMYPDLIYNPGRKKVLHHFLSMERIFKTGFFYDRFEVQARGNMQKELNLLNG